MPWAPERFIGERVQNNSVQQNLRKIKQYFQVMRNYINFNYSTTYHLFNLENL